MKMAELSRTTGITVATIKYYLREGLLHPGERISATQSQYDESHVQRLGLVRALIDVGGLPVSRTAEVLAAMEDPARSVNEVLGTTQKSVTGTAYDGVGRDPAALDLALSQVDDLIVERGWTVSADNPGRQIAAEVLATLAGLGRTDFGPLIQVWASAAEVAAEGDLNAVLRGQDRSGMVETVVVGTVLGDVMLMGLRRIAQENQSHKLFPTASPFVGGHVRVSL